MTTKKDETKMIQVTAVAQFRFHGPLTGDVYGPERVLELPLDGAVLCSRVRFKTFVQSLLKRAGTSTFHARHALADEAMAHFDWIAQQAEEAASGGKEDG